MAHLRPYFVTLLALALAFLAWDAGADALILPEVSSQQASSESPPESPVILLTAPERVATIDTDGRSAPESLLGQKVETPPEHRGIAQIRRGLQPDAVFSPPPLHLRHCVFLC